METAAELMAKNQRSGTMRKRRRELLWAEIPGFEGKYKVSNYGHVWNVKSGKPVSKWKAGWNRQYNYVTLYLHGGKRNKRVCRLVALQFVPNPAGKPEVNHFDTVHSNDRADNLGWCTRSENEQYKHFVASMRAMEEDRPFKEIHEEMDPFTFERWLDEKIGYAM